MKYCIQRPFVENVTALIKMCCFLEGVVLPLAEKKKVKKKPMPYTHQDVISFRRHFTAFDGKKGDTGAAALYGGKRKRTV